MDKKEAIKELKFEKNISAGVMEQLGTTKALRKIVAIQQKTCMLPAKSIERGGYQWKQKSRKKTKKKKNI